MSDPLGRGAVFVFPGFPRADLAPTIPTHEPRDFTIGDSVWWNLSDGEFPPSEGWLLSYAFIGPSTFQLGPNQITVDSATNSYQVRVPSSLTGPLVPGTYRWYRIFTNSTTGQRFGEVRKGATQIRPNPATALNAISRAEAMYGAYKAAHDAILLGGAQSYSIENRQFTKLDLKYLARMVGMYADKVRRERAAADAGGPVFGRKVAVAFRQPGITR